MTHLKPQKMLMIQQPEGCRDTDETFSSEHIGTIDVSLVRRKLRADQLKGKYQIVSCAITPNIIEANAAMDINPKRVAEFKADTLAKSLFEAPFLIIRYNGSDNDASHVQIDGNHRLRWMIEHGFKSFPATIIHIDHVKDCFIKFFESFDGIEWSEVDHKLLSEMDYGFFPHHDDSVKTKFDQAKGDK